MSFVTYTTVIAVRYPELDSVQDGITMFGNYLFGTQSIHGGFLPVFWNAPTAYMHAATDIVCVVEWIQSQFDLTTDENGCLAVLHNRNHMVTTFGNSEWVTPGCWEGSIQKCYILCRNDSTLSPSSSDSSWILERRKRESA